MTPDQLAANSVQPDDAFATVATGPDPTAAVIAITRALFGENFKLVEKDDPEIQGVSYLVLCVSSTLTVDEIVRRQNRWHELVCEAALGTHNRYGIMVDARMAPDQVFTGIAVDAR